MADNPMNRPSAGAGSPKKAGLTKPERINQRRSLPPPPPSAVQAAKQKSLPPPPPASSVDVDIDLDDDATVVRDRADFSGFFDPDEDAAAPAPTPALGSSPWALPPVEPRAELSTLADTAVISLDPSSPVNPLVAAPSNPSNDSPALLIPGAPSALAAPPAAAPFAAAAPFVPAAPFAAVTESERTEEVHEVEEVTVAENSKPDPHDSAPQAEAPSKTAEDDLDALFGRKTATRDALPAAALGSSSRGPAPPPPPSLRPPPAPSPPTRSVPVAAAPLPPPLAEASAPAAILPNPVLPNPGMPAAALPSPALPSPALPSPAFPAPIPSGELPRAPLPPPPLASSLPPVPLPPPLSGTSSRPPPLPPPPVGVGAGLSFNDDDVTQIFDRASSDSHPPPVLPPLPLPSFAPPPSAARSSVPFPSVPSTFPPPSSSLPIYKRKSVLAVAGAALLVSVLAFFLWPSSGRLVIAVAGPNGTVVDGIKVSLGGKVVCQNSPCEVNDLEAKSYLVTVEAEGFEGTAPQAVVVRSGEDTVHNVQLQAPVVTAPTGLDLPASGEGLTLYVDGKAMGSLPQKILDIAPGEHLLRVSGGERYIDEEKTVNVVEGQVLSLQPFTLKVKKGRATIEAGENAEGAVVKLDGTVIKLPHTADLSADKKHVLTATLEGYEDFEQDIVFEAGKAEVSFSVKFKPLADDAEATEEEVADNKSSAGNPGSGSRKSAGGGGKGTLNINSVPSAMVILDGRPIGKTPKLNIKVNAGAHSIVFVSSKGRKRATAKVPAGGSKTISVKL